jgi:molecular chaperone DnaK (HSP70)
MSVIGVDLGFQSALFAAPRGGGIDVLLNDYSMRQTPAFVNFGEKQRFQGVAAHQKFGSHFRSTVFAMKRLIGRKYADPDVQAELKQVFFEHCEMLNGRVGIVINQGDEKLTLSVEQVQANFLLKLQECASKELGDAKVVDCVIGVPCYYTDEQRQAMAEAVKIAQMNCLSLMNETTAVALAYGIYKQDLPEETATPRRVIFVDFGHSQL